MKKLLSLLLATAMLLTLIGCSSADDPPAEGEKPLLKVGTSADYAPFEFHKDVNGVDTIVGADIELAKYICDKLGYELEIVDMGFDGLIGGLNEGRFDMIIAGYTVDPKRDCIFSIPYYGLGQVVLTTVENKDSLNTAESLMGKKIGGLLGSKQAVLAQQYAGETAIIIPNFQDAVMMVQEGGLDGVICESSVADSVIAQNSDLTLTEAVIQTGEDSVGIAFKKGNEELLNKVNPILEEVIEKGLVNEWVAMFQEDAEATAD